MYHHCTAVLKPIKEYGIKKLALNASRDDNERVYYHVLSKSNNTDVCS
jgi:hypothetical protein